MRLPTSSEIELVLQAAERAGIEFCVHRCHMLDAKMAALWMSDPEAQRLAADLHYAPLPMPVIELVQKRIPQG